MSVNGVKLYDCIDYEVLVVKSNFSSLLTNLSITGSMSSPLSENTGKIKLHTGPFKSFGPDIILKPFQFFKSYIYGFLPISCHLLTLTLNLT